MKTKNSTEHAKGSSVVYETVETYYTDPEWIDVHDHFCNGQFLAAIGGAKELLYAPYPDLSHSLSRFQDYVDLYLRDRPAEMEIVRQIMKALMEEKADCKSSQQYFTGYVLECLKDREEAKGMYKASFGNNFVYADRLVPALLRVGEYEMVVEAAVKGLEREWDPLERGYLCKSLAEGYKKIGKYEIAPVLLENAIRKCPMQLEPRITLAVVYEQLSEWKKAGNAWLEIVSMNKDEYKPYAQVSLFAQERVSRIGEGSMSSVSDVSYDSFHYHTGYEWSKYAIVALTAS